MAVTNDDLKDAARWVKTRDPVRALALADNMRSAAAAVMSDMKISPGGDEYVYGGSMNHVEWLKDAAEEFLSYLEMG